jgi:hypothetical protein
MVALCKGIWGGLLHYRKSTAQVAPKATMPVWLFSRKTTLSRSQDTGDLESGLVRSRYAQVPRTIVPEFYAIAICRETLTVVV